MARSKAGPREIIRKNKMPVTKSLFSLSVCVFFVMIQPRFPVPALRASNNNSITKDEKQARTVHKNTSVGQLLGWIVQTKKRGGISS